MLACLMAGSLMAATPDHQQPGGIKSRQGKHGSGHGCRRGPLKNFRKDGDLTIVSTCISPHDPHDTRNYEDGQFQQVPGLSQLQERQCHEHPR